MMKNFIRLFAPCLFLLLSGCQSTEVFSIDYAMPAQVSFPAGLRSVAVVNNMSDTPENRPLQSSDEKTDRQEDNGEITHITHFYQGDGTVATESLAQAIADENYFDEVIICDSALRAHDFFPRENLLSQEEVKRLVQELDVDFLIALENVQIKAVRKIGFSPYYNMFIGTIDANVYPSVRIYLPNRQTPMATLNGNDSIFWEKLGATYGSANKQLLTDQELVKEASQFAGIAAVKQLLPYWETAHRILYTGGSANMRDAAIYVREENWEAAVGLWRQTYNAKRVSKKKKMRAAYNIALGYEMQDSISQALDWSLKAQALAYETDKVESKLTQENVEAEDVPNYIITSYYVSELQKREKAMNLLQMQMKRFEE